MDYVMITLRTEKGDFEADFELPAKMPLKRFSALILQSLLNTSPQQFGGWTNICLSHLGKPLNAEKSLADACIWDGQILTIQEVR